MGASKVIGVEKTIAGIKKRLEKTKRDAHSQIKALTEGMYKALSNQAEKVTQKRPDKAGKFGGNRNYRPSGDKMKAIVPKGDGTYDDSQSVEEFIKRSKKQKAELTPRQQVIANQRKQRQKEQRAKRQREIKAQIQRTQERIEALYQKELKKTLGVHLRGYKLRSYKATKRRMADRISRLNNNIAKKQAALSELNAQYKDENKRTRRKTPRKFKFVNRLDGRHGTATPQFNEIFRIGGYPRPKSWGTGNATSGGFFNRYLRHQWRTTATGLMQNSIFIGPGKPDWNDNQRFLRLLEDGGSMMGGPLYEGYRVHFKQVGRITHVSFVRQKRGSKKPVTIKPRRFVKRTLERIRQKLATANLSSLKPGDWRQLGADAGS